MNGALTRSVSVYRKPIRLRHERQFVYSATDGCPDGVPRAGGMGRGAVAVVKQSPRA